MKLWRRRSESDEGEYVFELFLDVLLCGFGAALALVVIFSVLPKSGVFARKPSLLPLASSSDGKGNSVEKPLLVISLSIDQDIGTQDLRWELYSEGQPIGAEIFRSNKAGENPLVVLKARPSATKVVLVADSGVIGSDIYRIHANIFYQDQRSSSPIEIRVAGEPEDMADSDSGGGRHLEVDNAEASEPLADGEIQADSVAVFEIDLSQKLRVLSLKDNKSVPQ